MLLDFNELPVGQQVSVQSTDQGVMSGIAVPNPGAPSTFTTLAQTRIVAKNGNDATADGSLALPYLTVQAAIDSITDAAIAKPYVVWVFPGVYATAFKLKTFVVVRGLGSGSGFRAATPLVGVTVINPDPAGVLDASFAGATASFTGLVDCALSSALVANYSAAGATGSSTLLLDDMLSESAITITGATINTTLYWKGASINKSVVATITDVGRSVITGFSTDVGGGNLAFTQAAAYAGVHDVAGSVISAGLSLTWTSAALANSLTVRVGGTPTSNSPPTITGRGAVLIMQQSFELAMSDAANRLSFGDNAASTLQGMVGGTNYVTCTPTVARLLTIDKPNVSILETTIVIRNLSATIPLDFAFASGTVATGCPTYVRPGGQLTLVYIFLADRWSVENQVQGGSVALTNGVSALVPADVTAQSSIDGGLAVVSGAFGTPVFAGRVVGTRAGGGGFVITSTLPATGATVATDQGTYNWQVV